jgi:hypothetical protein
MSTSALSRCGFAINHLPLTSGLGSGLFNMLVVLRPGAVTQLSLRFASSPKHLASVIWTFCSPHRGKSAGRSQARMQVRRPGRNHRCGRGALIVGRTPRAPAMFTSLSQPIWGDPIDLFRRAPTLIVLSTAPIQRIYRSSFPPNSKWLST